MATKSEPKCRRCGDTRFAPIPGPKKPRETPPCPTCGRRCQPCDVKYERAKDLYHWDYYQCGLCLGLGRGELTKAEYVGEIEAREAREARARAKDPEFVPGPAAEPYPGPFVEVQK